MGRGDTRSRRFAPGPRADLQEDIRRVTRPRERNGRPRFLRRIPTAAWLCWLVALMLGFAWSLVVPAFQTVDEPQNVAYAQYVAENGRPPTGREGIRGRSEEQRPLMRALRSKQFPR